MDNGQNELCMQRDEWWDCSTLQQNDMINQKRKEKPIYNPQKTQSVFIFDVKSRLTQIRPYKLSHAVSACSQKSFLWKGIFLKIDQLIFQMQNVYV